MSRGLPAVEQMRRERGKGRWMSGRFWVFFGIAVAIIAIVWWRFEQSEIQEVRTELLSKRRAVVKELGPRWYPLRDKLEKWAIACGAADPDEELIDRAILDELQLRKQPGLYLRLAQESAKDNAGVRDAAQKSLHDGFSACLLRPANPDPMEGEECEQTEQCPAGHMCSELKHCAKPSQPFNMRLGYQSLRMMDDEWVEQIQEITNMLTLEGASKSFESFNKYEIPMAIELLTRAEYFLVVVDEPPTKEAKESTDAKFRVTLPDGGVQEDPAISTAPHHARICAWRLDKDKDDDRDDDKQILSIRRYGEGKLMGGKEPKLVQTRIARQRQANSCALAMEVREALGDPNVPGAAQ